MTTQASRRKTISILLLLAGFILACGVALTPPVSPAAFDPTNTALELQVTALSLQLTHAALNSELRASPTSTTEPSPIQNTLGTPVRPLPSPTVDVEA